ncbi:MAG TPA: ABC transporter substrate-binding protein [Jatrophihabitantaceae bacterium]|jgi:peptide/nickel transport system substrate-binding protein
MRRSHRIPILIAGISALALAACSGPSNGKSDQSGQSGPKATLNLFMYQKPVGVFGPLASASGPDQEVNSLIYDTLLLADSQGKLVPMAATAAPTVSADGKTITYKLKPGLKWSDGQALTSKDLVFTYTRAADTNTVGAWSTYLTNVEGVADFEAGKAKTIAGFSAPDAQTFVIKQSVPDVGLVGRVSAIGILPEHTLATLPIKDFGSNAWFRKPTVVSGPFTFVDYKTDQFVHVTANPKFREPVGVKDVYVKPVTADVATQELSTGEMDIAWISADDVKTVEGFSNVAVDEVKVPGFVRAAWNQQEARFKDPRVRQAFLYAVDRAGLVDSALQGHGVVANDILDPIWAGTDINQYPYDPAKAKELLKAANWDSSKVVKLSWVPGGNPDRDAAATVLQQQLNEVGIKLKLDQVQSSWFTSAYKNHSFDMVLFGGGDYKTEPSNIGPPTGCSNWVPDGPNVGSYCNKQLDALVAQAAGVVDPEQRAAIWKQAAKIENADPSMMWLYSLNNLFGVNKRVQGFQPLNNTNWFEPWKWTVAG